MSAVLIVSVGALVYVYAGYPLVLQLLIWIRGARQVRRGDDLPPVSLVISAYNEAATIAEKLRNSLALNYPAERLEIVVISDASTDGTDAIVQEFAARGVRLCRQAERRGKTAGLNRFVPELKGDIVVFSDANAMYERDAIRQLVRNFADPEVGCVTGEARYLGDSATAAGLGERAYWGYEILIKRLETAAGSMVGGDGAIYAIRRSLWQTLPDDAINDFLNPLQIVAAGWRAIYEPEAVCYEEAAGTTLREYRRRVRIVSRSWRAVFQARGVLNPFRVGAFAFSLISHKVMRWLTGVFLAAAAFSAGWLAWRESAGSPRAWLAGLAGLAVISILFKRGRRVIGFAMYYVVISAASLVGIVRGTTGRVSGVWTTPRASAGEVGGAAPLYVGGGMLTLALAILASAAAIAVLLLSDAPGAQRAIFWSAVGVLAYVYLGYPVLLAMVSPLRRRPIRKSGIEPAVTLFVAAHDEAAVIAAKIRNCLELDYPRERLAIVVASDGSQDGTNEIVRSFAPHGVTLIAFPERRGKIAAINDGIRQVDTEIVVFSDANTFLQPGAVRALVSNFADDRVGAASGDVVLIGERAALARSEDLYYRYERNLQRAESELGSMLGVDGALYAIRRSLFVSPPSDTILDDMAIPMAVVRAGHRVVFEGDAVAHERGSDTASEEFSRKVRVVAGAVQFLLRRDSAVPPSNVQVFTALLSHKSLRWLSPLFAAVAFAASLVLARQSDLFLWATVAQVAFLTLGILGCVPALRRISVVGLAHYFCLVHAAAAVGFARGILGRQSVAWRRFARTGIPVGVSRA
jgi:cellulose synthase/poly-beta-1,6-N-acetylglucosamine synthase-like glycosyltransferase